MTGDSEHVYEVVVQGRVGPVIAHVLRPCAVQAEEQTVLRAPLTTTSIADLVEWLAARGLVVCRVALVG
jgi:hypothetical protein